MTKHTSVELSWADGNYTFDVGDIGHIRELQEKTDAGPQFLCARLESQHWRIDDVYETIRIGLIGGGAAPNKALALVQRYVAKRPLLENVSTAQAIILAALVGIGEDEVIDEPPPPPGESEAKEGPAPSSLSPQSTEAAPSSGSLPEK